VITDLGLLAPDPATCELVLTHVHPGVTVEQVRAATGWDLRLAEGLETTPPPTAEELEAVRAVERTRTGAA
jgi:acyl CoA:acetate/3-ketoacid CoA transferase beta subunit